jgi:fibro-slime domain-containing protein
MNDDDGCSAKCTVEDHHACDTPPGQPCRAVTCGDKKTEGAEQCDDGNNDLGDGCDPFCHSEPKCVNGTCEKVCGDGVVQPGEDCDDGNLRGGDGCSRACAVESGYECPAVADDEPDTVAVTIVYRDFRGFTLDPPGHIDFENRNGAEQGIVGALFRATLDATEHKPVYAKTCTTPGDPNTCGLTTHGAGPFSQWYRDDPTVNRTVVDKLSLTKIPQSTTYVFNSEPAVTPPSGTPFGFFPLDTRGWTLESGSNKMEALRTATDQDGRPHNFHFTSELRYWFDYRGGEVLSFFGDDDVWVFINNKLAVDIGGVHGQLPGSIALDDHAGATELNLRKGGTYEAVVFQAERHTSASRYKLTLKDFNAKKSKCAPICGDGIKTLDEVCDDGKYNGGYNSCATNCLRFGPRCGDGMVQVDHEECDNDVNDGAYMGCTPTCMLAARCGDGIVQTAQGEQCDDANDNPNDGCDHCAIVIL